MREDERTAHQEGAAGAGGEPDPDAGGDDEGSRGSW